jgi:hypothetical protein
LSDIIINENLKILQINYLARKVDVLFNFLSRSHGTYNRTYGKTMYIWETIRFPRLLNTLYYYCLFSSNSNIIEKPFTQYINDAR